MYGLGLERGAAHVDENALANNFALQKAATDHRFIWPIPQEEILSNPQITDQQNPGY